MQQKNINKKLREMLIDNDLQEGNKLKKAVLMDILELEDAECYIKDVLNGGCQSGTCRGLIYYGDTEAFFKEHLDDIDALREEAEDGTGEPLKIGYPLSNWLAWFGYEETIRKIAELLEIEY